MGADVDDAHKLKVTYAAALNVDVAGSVKIDTMRVQNSGEVVPSL